MQPVASPICPAPADGVAVFEHWLTACGQDPWGQLTPEAAKPYGFIWGAWLKFLAAAAPIDHAVSGETGSYQPWLYATPPQVLQFLNTATRSQKQLEMPSDITRRRYWRVLDRIYAHAQLHGWMEHNPVDGLAPQDRPPSEDPQGAILAPRMWRALQRQIPEASDLITARDRAVLLILMHLGITSEEVRGLQVSDVVWDPAFSAAEKTDPTATMPPQAPSPVALRICGERAMQSRTLDLPLPAAHALQQWLGFRAGYAPAQDQPALFCTRKAPALSTHTVLHLVTKTLQAAATARKLEFPPRLGPQVVRNTVIVQWLHSGMPVPLVLERAGLRTPHALAHLKSLVDWKV